MNLFKSNFLGSSWKTWFHSGDHTQNLKMPENFIPCNYKNKSNINLPLSSSPLPRRPWMNGNPKEAIPEVTPALSLDFVQAPTFQGPVECRAQWSRLTSTTFPSLPISIWSYRCKNFFFMSQIPSLSSSPSLLLFSHCYFLGRSRIQNELGVLALEK